MWGSVGPIWSPFRPTDDFAILAFFGLIISEQTCADFKVIPFFGLMELTICPRNYFVLPADFHASGLALFRYVSLCEGLVTVRQPLGGGQQVNQEVLIWR